MLHGAECGLVKQEKEESQVDIPHARFQRTDQWRPVYSWLESLDKDEVVKSKDISDWLTENPLVQEQLCSRHSRYHLMHYIKKCHMKILKRRDKKKVRIIFTIALCWPHSIVQWALENSVCGVSLHQKNDHCLRNFYLCYVYFMLLLM